MKENEKRNQKSKNLEDVDEKPKCRIKWKHVVFGIGIFLNTSILVSSVIFIMIFCVLKGLEDNGDIENWHSSFMSSFITDLLFI